ncbi:hypothetical protein GO730_17665 [Spirosoma sp. HMF3257]|uniref:histidine kinase n=1 Tax=Spirosoma telluris TaxID=2183553 RepID=A0A327NNB3_9BACT|nr:hypothetical protein [Spirosoma telluris]RAI75526.1 hypothetical protein HMF3257_17590 [Spirosoma telluris]
MNVLAVLLGILFVNAGFAQAPAKTERYEPFKTLIRELDDTTRIAQLIQFHERKSDLYQFSEAHQALTEALAIAKRLRDTKRIANVYLTLGLWSAKQNNYLQAIQQYQKALSFLKSPTDAERIHQLYIQIGNAYQHTLDLKNAEFYYAKVINAQAPKASLLNQSYAYGGLANLADQVYDGRKAMYYNQKALAVAKQLGRWDEYYSKLANLAFNYSDLNRPQESIALYKQCMAYIERVQKENRSNPVFERHFRMAIYDGMPYPLITLNRFDEAEQYAKLALKYGDQDNGYQKLHRMWAYDALKLLYEKKGDYAKALQASRQWAVYRDSIQNEARARQFAEVETRHQTKEKEDQINELNSTHTQQTRQLWAGVVGMTLLVLLVGTMIWQYRRVQRSRTKIQQQSDQLSLMMKELHHRVKNNLAIISSLLKLQANRLDDEKSIQAVRTGQQRVEAMSLIHQRLYQTDTITTVNMQEYLTDLTRGLILAYGYEPDNFALTLEVSQQDVDIDLAMPLGLIANELITNAFKYAFTSHRHPHLRIVLLHRDGFILEVQDNGPGIDSTYWQQRSGHTSFGKRLINSLCEQLDGHYELLNQNGTLFRLHIPEKVLGA